MQWKRDLSGLTVSIVWVEMTVASLKLMGESEIISLFLRI